MFYYCRHSKETDQQHFDKKKLYYNKNSIKTWHSKIRATRSYWCSMTSAEINAELVCPLRTPNFPPGTQDYDLKRHNLIEGVSKCMISDDRPCFTENGPNTSTPTASKARTPTVQRETGKSAIFCDKTDEYSFRHTTHLALMPLRIALILGTQNPLLTTLTVQLVPRWASPWNCWSINVDRMMRWQNHFMLGVARQWWTRQTTSNPATAHHPRRDQARGCDSEDLTCLPQLKAVISSQ